MPEVEAIRNPGFQSDIWLSLRELKPSHLREMAWLLVSNIFAVIIGLGLIKIIAKVGTVEYGKFALVLSLVPLVNAAIYIPVDQFSQRYFYTYLREKHLASFVGSLFRILKILAWYLAALFLVALVAVRFAFKFELRSIYFLIAAGLYIFVFANAIPFLSLLNTMRLRSKVALFAVGEKLAQLLALIGLSFFVGLNSSWVLAVFAALGTLFLVGKIKLVRLRISERLDEGETYDKSKSHQISRQLITFGLPILGFGILQWFQSYSERWVIQFTLDLDSVGKYAFMVMLANTSLLFVLSATSQFVGPIIWEKFSDLKDSPRVATGLKLIRLNVCFIGSVTVLSAGGLYFAGGWVIRILGNDKFSGSSKLLPLIFVGIGLFYMGQGLNAVGFGYDRMQRYAMAKVSGATLTVVLYLLGARFWGLSGVAWASVVANSIYVALTVTTNRTILNEANQYHDERPCGVQV